MLSIDTISNNKEETLIGLKKRGFKDLKIIDKIINKLAGRAGRASRLAGINKVINKVDSKNNSIIWGSFL